VALQRVSPKNKISKRAQLFLGVWKYLPCANNSFLRLGIVNPSVETEFQMHILIYTTLSILQHQAWNQIQ